MGQASGNQLLVLSGDPALYSIVALSLYVSLSAVALATLIGLPLGAFLALVNFPGRAIVVVITNAFMGLPPVVVGLAVYLLLGAAKAKALARGEVNLDRRGLYDDAWPEAVAKINNNIRNQFELPVLFYVTCLALATNASVPVAAVAIAWTFVASRMVHAYVHIYPNHVPTRRRVFMVGWVLVLLLLGLAVGGALA